MEQTCENCKYRNTPRICCPCYSCVGQFGRYSKWEANNTVEKCKDCKHYRLIGGYLKGSACLSCLSMDNWEAKDVVGELKECKTCKHLDVHTSVYPCNSCMHYGKWESKPPTTSSFTSEIQEAILSGKEVWFFNDDENEWTKFKAVSEEDPNPSDSPSIYAALYSQWSVTKPKETKTVEVYVSNYLLSLLKCAPIHSSLHISGRKTNTEMNLIKVSYEE